jgi:hypothetical protein
MLTVLRRIFTPSTAAWMVAHRILVDVFVSAASLSVCVASGITSFLSTRKTIVKNRQLPTIATVQGRAKTVKLGTLPRNKKENRGLLQKILSWARSSVADTCQILIGFVCFCIRNTTICTAGTQVAKTCMNLNADDNFLYVWCNYLE